MNIFCFDIDMTQTATMNKIKNKIMFIILYKMVKDPHFPKPYKLLLFKKKNRYLRI